MSPLGAWQRSQGWAMVNNDGLAILMDSVVSETMG